MAGPNEAEMKATERAAQSLKETLNELKAAGEGVTKSMLTGANAYSNLSKASNETKQAAIGVLEALVQQIKVTGEGVENINAYRQTIKLLRTDLNEVGDAAAAITERVRGMWGITSAWSTDITAS